MRTRISSIVLLLGFILTPHAAHAADDPFVGTWKYNYEKSTHDEESAHQMTRTHEPVGKGMKFTRDAIGADGKPSHSVYIVKFDGKDYPPVGGKGPPMSYRRIDRNTLECVVKLDGSKQLKQVLVLSPDGESFKLTETGNYQSGKPSNHYSVFEKQ
jgi:hypothetical protein